jgi:hypothetical protein
MTKTPITTILSPAQLRHLECINQAWAKSLAGWRDSVEGIIATGKALTAAKKELRKEFKALLKEPQFPFGQRMVQMLEKVAGHPVLSGEPWFAVLPPHWRTLHALSQLPDKVIKKALTDGRINPRMERKDVARLTDDKADAPIRLTPEQKLLALLDRADGAVLLMSALRKRPGLLNEIADDVARLRYVETPADANHTVAKIVETAGPRGGRAGVSLAPSLVPVADENDRRRDQEPPPPPEALFENPEDEPKPVFPEDADAADRSSGQSEDAGDWRSERRANLSRWHRG